MRTDLEGLAEQLRQGYYAEHGITGLPWNKLKDSERTKWMDEARAVRQDLDVLTRAAMTPMPPKDAA